jgi:hypothetical protein
MFMMQRKSGTDSIEQYEKTSLKPSGKMKELHDFAVFAATEK